MNKSAKRNRESRNEQLMFVKMSRSYFSTTDDKYSYKKNRHIHTEKNEAKPLCHTSRRLET